MLFINTPQNINSEVQGGDKANEFSYQTCQATFKKVVITITFNDCCHDQNDHGKAPQSKYYKKSTAKAKFEDGVLLDCFSLLFEDPSMEKGKGIAEEKVGKYLNDESYKIELVAFFKKFDEEKDDGCDGVDRQG